jgi:predicted double-glycine peptidase
LIIVLAVAAPPSMRATSGGSFSYAAPTDRPAYLGIRQVSFSQASDSIHIQIDLWESPPSLDSSLSSCPTTDGREPFWSIWVPVRDQIRWLVIDRYHPQATRCAWRIASFAGAQQDATAQMQTGSVGFDLKVSDLLNAGQSVRPLHWQGQVCDVGTTHGQCWDYPAEQVDINAVGTSPVVQLTPWYHVGQVARGTNWGQTGCGQASATMVLQHFVGKDSFTMAQVEAQLDTNNFAFILNIRDQLNVMSDNRIRAEWVRRYDSVSALSDLKARIGAGQPLIVLIPNVFGLPGWDAQTLSHYVVVYGFDHSTNTVYYDDPTQGKQATSWTTFSTAWARTSSYAQPFQYVWSTL